MRILEIHNKVNTIEEVKEVEKYFDAFYVMGIYEPADYSWQHNRKYGLDGSLFAIDSYFSMFFPKFDELKKFKKPIIVDFVANHIGIRKGNENFAFADKRIGNYEWVDTYQLNYTSHFVLETMKAIIKNLVTTFDGLRFDMAHLLLQKNYNKKHQVYLGYEPLKELIKAARETNPNCILIAEAYQDYEDLRYLAFDYIYRVEERRGEIIDNIDEKDLIIIDNHDEQFLYWNCFQDLELLKIKLKNLSSFKNTLWYLPAIMGYTKRPSANYWLNREWDINPEVKEIYLEVLKEVRK